MRTGLILHLHRANEKRSLAGCKPIINPLHSLAMVFPPTTVSIANSSLAAFKSLTSFPWWGHNLGYCLYPRRGHLDRLCCNGQMKAASDNIFVAQSTFKNNDHRRSPISINIQMKNCHTKTKLCQGSLSHRQVFSTHLYITCWEIILITSKSACVVYK